MTEQERRVLVHQLLAKLTPEHRSAVAAHYGLDLDSAPVQAYGEVQSLIADAMAALRRILDLGEIPFEPEMDPTPDPVKQRSAQSSRDYRARCLADPESRARYYARRRRVDAERRRRRGVRPA